MKSFLEEYGFAILTAIVVILLIAFATPVGGAVKNAVLDMIGKFSGQASTKLAEGDDNQTVYIAWVGDKVMANVTTGSNTDTFKYYVTYTSEGKLIEDEPHEGDTDLNNTEQRTRTFYPATNNAIDQNSSFTVTVEDLGTGAKFTSGTINIPSSVKLEAAQKAGVTFSDGITLTWEQLQLADNGTKYGYDASAISDTSIGSYAFRGCSSLTSATIGNSVPYIGDSAFYGCTSLTSVIIGNSVTSIGGSAFSSCRSLTSITIPDSVTSIASYAFYGCSSLTSFIVDSNNSNYKSIDGVLFTKDEKTLVAYPTGKAGTSYTVPDSVTSIGTRAFFRCSSLTSIIIPDSVTSIGGAAFYYCENLTSITIPDSVTSIWDSAFSYCTRLISVTIGNSVTSIRRYAFKGCYSLTSVTFKTTTGWYTGASAGKKTTALSSSDLTDASTAATYLKDTYSSNYWTR